MKNFQVNHGQCESIIIPKNIFPLKALSNYSIRPLPFWQQNSLHLTGPGIYPQIYHRTSCPEVLICKGSNKKYRRGGFFHEKERLFHLLWKLSALEGNLTMWLPFLHPPEKGLPLPFSLAKTRIYLDTQLKEQLTALFWKLPPACSLFLHTE